MKMTQPSPTATSTNSDQPAQAAADWSDVNDGLLIGGGAFTLFLSWISGISADDVSAGWVLPSSLLGMFLFIWGMIHQERKRVDLSVSRKTRLHRFAYGTALLLLAGWGSIFIESWSPVLLLSYSVLTFLAGEGEWRMDKRFAERGPLSPETVAHWDRWIQKAFSVLALLPFLVASIRVESDLSGVLSFVAGGGEPWLVFAIGLVTAAAACFAPIPSKKVFVVVLGASFLALLAWNTPAWMDLAGGRSNTGAQILLGLFPLLGLFVLILAKGHRFDRTSFRLASLIWMAWLVGPAFPNWPGG